MQWIGDVCTGAQKSKQGKNTLKNTHVIISYKFGKEQFDEIYIFNIFTFSDVIACQTYNYRITNC